MAARGPGNNDEMAQIQRQIQQDWANREYIEVITCAIKRMADFLNAFGIWLSRCWASNRFPDNSCRARLATLNEKLTSLERRVEFIEAKVSQGETLT